jgi:hypothetical protein
MMFQLSAEDDYDVDDWPDTSPLGKLMAEFEESLLCSICRGHFDNPQMLKCGHSYCAICIQKHFDTKLNRNKDTSEACPSCRAKAELFDIKANRALAASIAKFKAMRVGLLELMTKD